MKLLYTFTIEIPIPSTLEGVSTNNLHGHRGVIRKGRPIVTLYKKALYKKFENTIAELILDATDTEKMSALLGNVTIVHTSLTVEHPSVMVKSGARPNRKFGDLTNFLKATEDAVFNTLKKYCDLDDAQVFKHSNEKKYSKDRRVITYEFKFFN